MTRAYFAKFVTLPTIISAPGKYTTRCGEMVTVHSVSRLHDFGCTGNYSDGLSERWHKSGRLMSCETNNDIIARVGQKDDRL